MSDELLLAEIVSIITSSYYSLHLTGKAEGSVKPNTKYITSVSERILAKVKQHYPIMFEEEAELDGFMLKHGWSPPKEWKRLDRPDREKIDACVKKCPECGGGGHFTKGVISSPCWRCKTKGYVIDYDQILALIPDIEEAKKQGAIEWIDEHRARASVFVTFDASGVEECVLIKEYDWQALKEDK